MLKKRLQSVRRIRGGTRVLALAVAIGTWSFCGLGLTVPGYAGGAQGLPQAALGVARRGAAQATQGQPQTHKSEQREASRTGAEESGRRDPFYLPPPPKKGAGPAAAAGISGPLPAGKRGLMISELRLEGIVHQVSNNSMIAVVANPSNLAYFLRVNDALYDGVVSKITSDSVTFTERYRSANGTEATREVTKRLGAGSGENR